MADEQMTPAKVQRELSVDSLAAGDRAAMTALGITGAEAIKKWNMAVFMVDAFGRVRLMPPQAVQVLARPRLEDAELDELEEMDAIRALLSQGDSEDEISQYLHRRAEREAGI